MVKSQTIVKHKWLLLLALVCTSLVITGCNKGSLGIKTGAIQGTILDDDTNQPISDVLVWAKHESDNKSVNSQGDGSFYFGDCAKGVWNINVEKSGYVIATDSVSKLACNVFNGDTLTMSPIKMAKTYSGVKGVLRGYPIDEITGRALTNFTVTQETPFNERKSKSFDRASDFRDTGWTGLEGGVHNYSISSPYYETYKTETAGGEAASGITIGKAPANLGTIKMKPLTVNVSGTLRNMPGYILKDGLGNIVVWAESAGKIVASYTSLDADGAGKGTVAYTLSDVPVTSGSIAVKCKVKGYDIITINPAVSIASANPGGTIAAIDCDFGIQEPIRADLRVIVLGSKPEEGVSTFNNAEVAKVYVQAGGIDVVQSVEVTSINYHGEVTVSGVMTAYPFKVKVINQNRGYCNAESEEITIPEGTESYPVTIKLEEN